MKFIILLAILGFVASADDISTKNNEEFDIKKDQVDYDTNLRMNRAVGKQQTTKEEKMYYLKDGTLVKEERTVTKNKGEPFAHALIKSVISNEKRLIGAIKNLTHEKKANHHHHVYKGFFYVPKKHHGHKVHYYHIPKNHHGHAHPKLHNMVVKLKINKH